MTVDKNSRPDDESSAVPSQWEGWPEDATVNATKQTTEDNAVRLPPSRPIKFPGMNVRELAKDFTNDGRPWLMLKTVDKRTNEDGETENASRIFMRGSIRVERIYQIVKLTRNRYRAKVDQIDYTYVVRTDMGDDEPEPLVGRVTQRMLRESGMNKSSWIANLGLFEHVNSRDYGTIKNVIIATAKDSRISGTLRVDDVFAETGMLRIVTEDGERLVFLTPGDSGALGSDGWNDQYRTELPAEYENESARRGFGYRPATESTLKESFEELFKMLELMPNKPHIPAVLLGVNTVAPMHGIHDGARTAVAVIGPKKQGKTSLVCLLQANQSPVMRGRTLEPTVNGSGLSGSSGSTVWGIGRAINRFGGFVVSIDDVITAYQMENETDCRKGVGKIDAMLRNLHGGAPDKAGGFDPATKEAKKAEYAELKALPIFTLEDIPRTESIETVTSRMIVVEHETQNDIRQDVIERLWSVESGSLRFNAMCAIVQEYVNNPTTFDEAFREAESYVDAWEIADFARERQLYASALAGNIVAIRVAKSHGVKTPTIAKVAEWLYDAAKLQSKWCAPEEREETNPLETFRDGMAEVLRMKFGSFSVPTDTKTPVVYPERTGESIGELSWSHLGYTAGPIRSDDPRVLEDGASGASVSDWDGVEIGEYPIAALNKDNRIGTFHYWKAGSGQPPKLEKLNRQADGKENRRFQFTNAEFGNLYNKVEDWARRNKRVFVSKPELIERLEAEKVAIRFVDKGKRGIQVDAYWLSRVGQYE